MDKLKVGLIGTGNFGRQLIEFINVIPRLKYSGSIKHNFNGSYNSFFKGGQ